MDDSFSVNWADMKRHRVLYIGFNVEYINPTRKLLVEALAQAADLVCFGPGFVGEDVLQRGVNDFYEEQGPFFAVISDEYVLQDMVEDAADPVRFVNHACSFDPHLLIMALNFREFLRRVDCRRFVALLQIDYYSIQPSFIDRLGELSDYVIGWGAELIATREMANDRAQIAGLAPVDRQILARWTDRYRNFLLTYPGRVVSIPHLIGTDEFCERPLHRRRQWTVVGADYTERLSARRALDSAGIPRSGRLQPYLFAAFEKIHINPYAHSWSIRLLQRQFRRALTQAKYAYTCGAVVRCAIRKFFELPASGCVLIADRCEGFEALGFRDRQNAVVARGSEIIAVHNWLSGLDDAGQGIANAGRELIRKQHSTAARSRQLSAVFDAVSSNMFAGSRWVEGRFLLRRPDATEEQV